MPRLANALGGGGKTAFAERVYNEVIIQNSNPMSTEKKPDESSLVIESALSPIQAIDNAAIVANVRGKISYAVQMVGPRRWRVSLAQGSLEDLKKALHLARGVKIMERE